MFQICFEIVLFRLNVVDRLAAVLNKFGIGGGKKQVLQDVNLSVNYVHVVTIALTSLRRSGCSYFGKTYPETVFWVSLA